MTESNSHVSIDDGERSRLSERDLAEVDSPPPLTSGDREGKESVRADNPHPSRDSNEPQRTDTRLLSPNQANVETEQSECNLAAASSELNQEVFHDAKVDDDIWDEYPVLDEKDDHEHRIERTPPLEAAHEAGSDTIKLTEGQNNSNEISEKKSGEHEAKRCPSPASQQLRSDLDSFYDVSASQQLRSDSPNHDLREIESFLSNIGDV